MGKIEIRLLQSGVFPQRKITPHVITKIAVELFFTCSAFGNILDIFPPSKKQLHSKDVPLKLLLELFLIALISVIQV